MDSKESLELELGECYVLRNGLVTGPLRLANNGTSYLYEADVVQPSGISYIDSFLETGQYLTRDEENKYDIIKKLDKDENT